MRVRLRRTELGDLDFVLAAESDLENVPFIGQWPREEHLAALGDGDVAHLIVTRIADGARVGYVILTGLGEAAEGVRLRRICITEKGQGYGTETLRLVKQLVFEELGAPRLWLKVRPHNVRAQRLYAAAGMSAEPGRAEGPIVMSLARPGRDDS